MNVLADNHELKHGIKLKFYSIKNLITKWLHNRPAYDNEYIKTKINPYDENFHGNKKLTNINIMDIQYYY